MFRSPFFVRSATNKMLLIIMYDDNWQAHPSYCLLLVPINLYSALYAPRIWNSVTWLSVDFKTTCSAYQHLTDETGWRCWVYSVLRMYSVVCVMSLSLPMDVFLLVQSTPVLRFGAWIYHLIDTSGSRSLVGPHPLTTYGVASKSPFSSNHNKHFPQSKGQVSETHITLWCATKYA